jgi:hypothetical protein
MTKRPHRSPRRRAAGACVIRIRVAADPVPTSPWTAMASESRSVAEPRPFGTPGRPHPTMGLAGCSRLGRSARPSRLVRLSRPVLRDLPVLARPAAPLDRLGPMARLCRVNQPFQGCRSRPATRTVPDFLPRPAGPGWVPVLRPASGDPPRPSSGPAPPVSRLRPAPVDVGPARPPPRSTLRCREGLPRAPTGPQAGLGRRGATTPRRRRRGTAGSPSSTAGAGCGTEPFQCSSWCPPELGHQ